MSDVTYQVEQFSDILPELPELWKKHWKVSALYHDKIELQPNIELYKIMEQSGRLHISTVRNNGKLIGYFFNILIPESLHYTQISQAGQDIYYIDPGDNPVTLVDRYRKLARFVEGRLKEIGIKQHFTTTKLHSDLGKLWEKLGYTEIERRFSKLLMEE